MQPYVKLALAGPLLLALVIGAFPLSAQGQSDGLPRVVFPPPPPQVKPRYPIAGRKPVTNVQKASPRPVPDIKNPLRRQAAPSPQGRTWGRTPSPAEKARR